MDENVIEQCMANFRSLDLAEYIEVYKNRIRNGFSQKNLRAWECMSTFRCYWVESSAPFVTKLALALDKVSDFFLSSHYKVYSELLSNYPDEMTKCFKMLFNESKGISERYNDFHVRIDRLRNKHFQIDCHDVSKFLSLYYPLKHYIYNKNAMKQLLWLADMDINVQDTDIDTYLLYKRMCSCLQKILMADKELMAVYGESHAYKSCPKESMHLLVQDFAYALHENGMMKKVSEKRRRRRELLKVVPDSSDKVVMATSQHVLANIEKHHDDKSHITGFDGERWVMEYEREKLIGTKYAKKVSHESLKSPFIGYDIHSYTREGEDMFIEVKTSEKDVDTLMGITQNELDKSREYGDKYYLYRLYYYDNIGKEVQLKIIRGDLSHLCEHPIKYWVKIE